MTENLGPLKKGTAILTAKPFAFILASKHINERCDHCLKSEKIFKCSGCQYVNYCNRICQKKAWSVHKSECANMKRVSPKVLPDMARLMARIIVRLNNGGEKEIGYYTDTKGRKFKDLMSHYTDIKKDEKRMEQFMCMCGVLFEFLGDTPMPNSAELMGIYGRICINSFNICDNDMNSIGVGIYLGASIMDHSCQPNAVVVFNGTTIIVRTVEDLPCLDWSLIRMSYIDVMNSTKERRKELQGRYYFLCKCQRCEQPELMAEAAVCPNELCTYPCSPDANKCPKCNADFPEGFKETFDEVSEFSAHHIQEMKNMAYLDVSKMCLKRQEGILHHFNVLHVQTLQAAFDSAVKLERYDEAEFYAKKLIPGYLLYYGEIHPLTGILYGMMGRAQVNLGKPRQAFELLKKAREILEITHGAHHPIIELLQMKLSDL